jgi:hypothetical protein
MVSLNCTYSVFVDRSFLSDQSIRQAIGHYSALSAVVGKISL